MHASGPNTAACLAVDGDVVAFAEEERFIRKKLATDIIPVRACEYCLREASCSLSEVDSINVSWDMNKYPDAMRDFFASAMNHPDKDEYSRNYEEISLRSKSPEFFSKRIEMALRRNGHHGRLPTINYMQHHKCHAVSVFYPSPFEEALIFCIDGSGEEQATTIWRGKGNDVELLHSHNLPNSLGYFYAALTEYLGFSVFTGEGKVMGLAPYGNPDPTIRKKLDDMICIEGEGYRVNPEYIYFASRTYSFRHTDKLIDLLGQMPRKPESEITQWHKNLAWEVQDKLERVVRHLIVQSINKYHIRNICIAGGVAMNCKMNGMVASMEEVDRCFVTPASNDAGGALGAALLPFKEQKNVREKAREFSVYSGPAFGEDEIMDCLKEAKITNYLVFGDDELYSRVGRDLSTGAIVGWFQGRMEVGPRALGNRSILADPSFPDMKDKINAEVKHREGFRPFAPAIMAEHAADFFRIQTKAEYEPYHSWMLQAVLAEPGVEERIPAVVHVDRSIRPQIVSASSNKRFYNLMNAFFNVSGLPVLLNTSFNVRGEPIVMTPEDALRCFFSTGLDVLVIGNIYINK